MAVLPVAVPQAALGRVLTSRYGWRPDPKWLIVPEFHPGTDFAVPTGTPVRSVEAGTVTEAGIHPEYGKFVVVRHPNGWSTKYAHLSSVHVDHGAGVGEGQTVGLSGATGRVTGPHLHLEARRPGGSLADPLAYLGLALPRWLRLGLWFGIIGGGVWWLHKRRPDLTRKALGYGRTGATAAGRFAWSQAGSTAARLTERALARRR